MHELELTLKAVLLVFEGLILLCVEQPALKAKKCSDKVLRNLLKVALCLTPRTCRITERGSVY